MSAARRPLTGAEQRRAPTQERLEAAKRVDPDVWAIELECRRESLISRDKLLQMLSKQAAIQIRKFVDEVKLGSSFTVPKNGLDRFRQPE
jgi:hypothetical protein